MKTIASLILISFALLNTSTAQEVFSIDIPSGAPFAGGDILVPGPGVVIPDVGFAAGGALTGVEIDGISDGMDLGTELLFSVDNASTGLAGTDVSLEFGGGGAPFDHPADIFYNPLMTATNLIFRDGDGIANPLLAPGFGLSEPFPVATDNVDAYDLGTIGAPAFAGAIFFTVGAASPGGLSTDTIHFVPSPGGAIAPYVTGAGLSLAATDDIDAIFVLDDGDMAFTAAADVVGFSLDRGNTSLTAGSALSLLYAGGAALSPADVFILTGGGGAFYVPAFAHGLAFTDNVDALDQVFVPEPGSLALVSLVAMGFLACNRRRKA